jgi:hypothetical protein
MNEIVISGIKIEQDGEGRFRLNDLHKASGSLPKHRPSLWAENQKTQELIAELEGEAGIPALDTQHGGATPGTYVAKELVYAYAMWVSAKFHLNVIRTFDSVVTGQIPAPIPDALTQATLRTFDALLARISGTDQRANERFADVDSRVSDVAQAVIEVAEKIDALPPTVMLERPSNAEAITHIRKRMGDKYLLPSTVVDAVMTDLHYSPRPAGNVNNPHRNNGTYVVWWQRDVTKTFERFLRECISLTPQVATHADILGSFRLIRVDAETQKKLRLA